MTEIFTQNIITVYFFYGLSFFSMGLAILLEAGHTSESDFARALKPLSWFGLLHGSHEWFEMFLLIHTHLTKETSNLVWINPLRLLLLAVSFCMLIAFGTRLITGNIPSKIALVIGLVVVAFWLGGLVWVSSAQLPGQARIIAADVYTRYALAIPGAALTVWGLILQRRRFFQEGMQSFGNDVALAALAFGLYGGIGQLFASPSTIFPSYLLNAEAFIRWFGFPIQVFRAAMACFAAIFIIRSLRAFEVENNRKIENLREAQLAERKRLESLRSELLHRTVKAQENERQRIARELHDETGQALTAISLGLRGLSEILESNPQKATQQAKQLQSLTTQSMEELQRLVTGLHPPQLDDLGLLAALRWFSGEILARFELPVSITCNRDTKDIPPDIRIVLFRITQEAITNVIRHAGASQAIIQITLSEKEIDLKIEDDGKGFNVDSTLQHGLDNPCWGLLGMMERAMLVNGNCQILSQPGTGTIVQVQVPVD